MAPTPLVPGTSLDPWIWLREAMVRPHVVARVRAALAAGHRVSADDVALAILRRHDIRPYRDAA